MQEIGSWRGYNNHNKNTLEKNKLDIKMCLKIKCFRLGGVICCTQVLEDHFHNQHRKARFSIGFLWLGLISKMIPGNSNNKEIAVPNAEYSQV